MSKLFVKKGDVVKVLAGKNKGQQGKVLACFPDSGFLKVDGVNMVKKAQKARKQGESSQIIEIPGNIHASNVQVVCPTCGKATRIGRKEVDGKNARYCKHEACGAVIEVVKAAKVDKKTAKKVAKKDKSEKAEKVDKTDKAEKATKNK